MKEFSADNKAREKGAFQKPSIELSPNDALYQSLFDNMLNGFAYHKLIYEKGKPVDYEFLAANPAFEKHTGLRKVVGKKVSEVIPGILEGDRELFERYTRVAEGGGAETFEIHVDSLKAWFSISVYCPQKGYFVTVFDSITSRKKSEEELQLRNILLTSQHEASIDGILVVDDDSHIVSYNHRFVEMWGIPIKMVEDKIDEPMLEFVADQIVDAPAFIKRVQYLYEHRQEVSRDEIMLKDGRTFDRYSSSLFGPENRYYGRVWYFRDITEKKNSEAQMKRLIAAIEQAAEIIVTTDKNGLIEYVNPAFETATGYSEKEVLGKNINILNSGKLDPAYLKKMWDTISGGEVWQGQFINVRKDGSLYTEESTISPVKNEAGEVVSYVAVKRDITELLKLQEDRERMQAQLLHSQKMESVGRLAGGVAHDFNNMLNVIIGNTDLVLMDIDSSNPIWNDLHEIKTAAMRSADLTRQLLAFARKQVISPQAVDINNNVDVMHHMLRRLIGERIELKWSPSEGIWPIKIDPTQLDQILTNLALNARDAIKGTGSITIRTENVHLDKSPQPSGHKFIPGDYVLLQFQDTGVGIEPENLTKVFEPFFTTKQVGKGTGLGLATVYGIVKQNSGWIFINSEVGKGSSFNTYFPRHTGLVPEEEGAAKGPAMGAREIVLLVEDDKAMLQMTQRILENLNYKVLPARQPSEALKQLESLEGKIDLLITDIIMPEMTGTAMADQISAKWPEIKKIFISGYPDDALETQSLDADKINFIQKPFSIEGLALKIREVLES